MSLSKKTKVKNQGLFLYLFFKNKVFPQYKPVKQFAYIYPKFHASCEANIRQLTKVTVTFQDIQI